ncbi:MAG: trehalose-phosphatase [Steroidobacteraceae bacterium]
MTPDRLLPDREFALFLDVDGTLLEIAPAPDLVQVPDALRGILEQVAQRANGALALVSGRSLATLDELFSPSVFPAAGLHGVERRDAVGRITRASADASTLATVSSKLQSLVAAHPGLLLEDKGGALALHYRAAPELGEMLHKEISLLQQTLAPQLQLKRGKCVLELLPDGHSKRTAIEAFMREPPFAGRTPIFVGDDVTDEDGFAAVNALGGYSVRVGDAPVSVAQYRFPDVSAVIGWLNEGKPHHLTAY